ncbi:hypothetical protein HOL63_02315 [Candidatus Peregrinibacteria bacterium]|jgi:hypothetical protein|nr:hypothetical protein [Candidatus Peregrinibacteria bacterium]MBT5468223.1 hypothetical protein [Candidatus Peregrinibacteria bacterium]MBT7337822.1 hypothetical protein [Candidatus Peregrinibacteria bacterium]
MKTGTIPEGSARRYSTDELQVLLKPTIAYYEVQSLRVFEEEGREAGWAHVREVMSMFYEESRKVLEEKSGE